MLLAPQVSMVHALSHGVPGGALYSGEGEKRKPAAAKVCDTCLALAQLGAALPSSFDWIALRSCPPAHDVAAPVDAIARRAGAYDARAPPVDLT